MSRVTIQTADFDVGAELAALRSGDLAVGALASFIGTVRDRNGAAAAGAVSQMELEHYPGMTERAIEAMIDDALQRFDIRAARVVHRVGVLQPGEQIVLVAVASAHRGQAFQACEFLMDYLKTQAPFWKKETTADGARWVDARVADDAALARWGHPGAERAMIDTLGLRTALGRFTTGVTIVSCVDEGGGFVGLTANSFSSLSLNPPLVLWSLRATSPTLPAFVAASHFAINVLAEAQVDLSRRFAGRAEDKFGDGGWALGVHGSPVLAGCVAAFECETVSHQAAGDHLLFVGRVLAYSESALQPLVFQGGHYHLLGEVL